MPKHEDLSFRRRVYRNAVLYLFYTLRYFARLIPFKLGIHLFGRLGKLTFRFLSHERRVMRKSLKTAFPELGDDEILDISKKTFVHLGKSLFEILNMKKIHRMFDDYVTIEGKDHLKKAVRDGGCIYVTGHVGNWELMAYYLAHRGFNITPIAREIFDARLNEILLSLREENGVKTITRRTASTSREVIRAIKGNAVLGVLVDQDTNVPGIFVDFFGKKAYTTVGVATLYAKFKCDVVAGFIHRVGDRHQVVITPLDLVDTGDRESDIRTNTQICTKAVEDAIREYPDQWVWMHKRWKTRPDGENSKK